MDNTIIERANIDSGWAEFDVGDNRGTYLIAIKANEGNSDIDALPLDKLRGMVVEVAIDSGMDGNPMPIQRCSFRFNEKLNGDKINDLAALSQTSMLPRSKTYIRVVSFSDGVKEVKSGSMSVSINMVAVG